MPVPRLGRFAAAPAAAVVLAAGVARCASDATTSTVPVAPPQNHPAGLMTPPATWLPATASPRPSATPPHRPPNSTSPAAAPTPTRRLIPGGALQTARSYLAVRHDTFGYPTAEAWAAALGPLMTAAAHQKLLTGAGGAAATEGEEQRVAQRHGWRVTTEASCSYHPDAGPPSRTRAVLLCRPLTRTVDRGGHDVPAGQLPWHWPHNGQREARVLYLEAADSGRWLVADDQTGQAG